MVSDGRSVQWRCCGSSDGGVTERGYCDHKQRSRLQTHPREQHRNLKLSGSSSGGDEALQQDAGSPHRGDREVGVSNASWRRACSQVLQIRSLENALFPVLPEQASEQGRGFEEALFGERFGGEQEGLDGDRGQCETDSGYSVQEGGFWAFVPFKGSKWGPPRTGVCGNGCAYEQVED